MAEEHERVVARVEERLEPREPRFEIGRGVVVAAEAQIQPLGRAAECGDDLPV